MILVIITAVLLTIPAVLILMDTPKLSKSERKLFVTLVMIGLIGMIGSIVSMGDEPSPLMLVGVFAETMLFLALNFLAYSQYDLTPVPLPTVTQ